MNAVTEQTELTWPVSPVWREFFANMKGAEEAAAAEALCISEVFRSKGDLVNAARYLEISSEEATHASLLAGSNSGGPKAITSRLHEVLNGSRCVFPIFDIANG